MTFMQLLLACFCFLLPDGRRKIVLQLLQAEFLRMKLKSKEERQNVIANPRKSCELSLRVVSSTRMKSAIISTTTTNKKKNVNANKWNVNCQPVKISGSSGCFFCYLLVLLSGDDDDVQIKL